MSVGAPSALHDLREVPVEALKPGLSPRLQEDDAHARMLAESFEHLPPILVHQRTMAIIDGFHRRLAAQMLGRKTVAVALFTGTEREARVEAVRLNVAHGKPLSSEERERAAHRVMRDHPTWSDRRIAEACGLSPRSVAAVRRRSSAGCPALDAREGRDGRVRPADPAAVRAAVAEILRRNPNISLRQVACMVPTSQATVLDVRRRLQRGESPLPPRLRGNKCDGLRPPSAAPVSEVSTGWREDPALLSTSGGQSFVSWFRGTAIDEMVAMAHVAAIPVGRVYLVADEARRRAAAWTAFANTLEKRAR